MMPCKPNKARKLLRSNKAGVVGHHPFTIQLLHATGETVQEVDYIKANLDTKKFIAEAGGTGKTDIAKPESKTDYHLRRMVGLILHCKAGLITLSIGSINLKVCFLTQKV